jgi:hypothetical protein
MASRSHFLRVSCLALVLAAGPVLAAEVTAPTWIVGQCQSSPQQSRAAFLRQAAAFAAQWTDRTGYEACGVLGRQDSGVWSLQLTTNYSQLQCLFAAQALAPGAHRTILQLHTHPTPDAAGNLILRPASHRFATAVGDTRLEGVDQVHLDRPHGFSAPDVAAGGGYLAAGGRLYVLKADGQTEDLGALSSQPVPTCTARR